MLTSREMMKVAILQRCAEAGLSPEQTCGVVKEAADQLEKDAFLPQVGAALKGIAGAGKSLLGGAGDVLKALSPMATAAGGATLLAPVAAGGLAGHLLARGTEISDEDIKEEKKRELVEAYRSATERADSNRRTAKSRASRPRAARSLL